MQPFLYENQPPLQARVMAYEQRRLALKKLGMPATLEDMADRMGVAKSTLARILAGSRKKLPLDDERALANALADMEAEARRTYGPEAVAGAARVSAANEGTEYTPPPMRTPGRLPVFGRVSAGSAVHLDHQHVIDHVEMGELAGSSNEARAPFLLEVVGTSMEPRFLQGERVIVSRARPPRPGQDCVFEFRDGHAELKIYRGTKGARVWYDQYNDVGPDYDPEKLWFAADNIVAMHAVIGVLT